MIHVEGTKHAPGTIILPAPVQPRFYEFQMSMEHLKVPAGTKWSIHRGCDVAHNLNQCVRTMTGEWAWFLGDDHSFREDTLMKLLDYNLDVVVPISPCKVAPFMPCVIHKPEDGSVWRKDMLLYAWEELSGPGLMALPQGDFIGQAGMLVRKPVLDAIGYPWFKTGMFDRGQLQEDLWFCHELQQLGYTVWVDRDIIFDHWFLMGVTARKHEGMWVPALKSGVVTMVLPDAKAMTVQTITSGNGKPRVTWVPDEVWRGVPE